ncbi:NUDIX domain-containing protein [Streptomyces nigrescens]|nr:NUDIX domain-containing protein [Streptomyces libani]MCX5451430.1 NUDIX domain-containing protein [Streptomyces libani]
MSHRNARLTVHGRRLLVEHVCAGDLRWQFPAGKLEVGESSEQAAVREPQEETGGEFQGWGFLRVTQFRSFLAVPGNLRTSVARRARKPSSPR